MADKKPSKGEKMYGKGPKIRPVEDAAEEKAEPAAEKKAEADAGPGAEAAENAGAGGIPLANVHVRESKAMHTRHQQEYAALTRRHAKERDGNAEGAAA